MPYQQVERKKKCCVGNNTKSIRLYLDTCFEIFTMYKKQPKLRKFQNENIFLEKQLSYNVDGEVYSGDILQSYSGVCDNHSQ